MIIKEYSGFFGSCRNEQEFKMKYLSLFERRTHFCIETEETVLGFPDAITLTDNGFAEFYEFKFTNNGIIKFQPSQIAFYKKHCIDRRKMLINVLAYNKKTDKVHLFSVREIFDSESPYARSEGVKVSLRRAENESVDC